MIYWLEKFKDGDVQDFEYQRKIIDTFVREVKVYDNKVIISYNYSGENSQNTIKIDDTVVLGFNPNGGAYESLSEHAKKLLKYIKIDISNRLIINSVYFSKI